MKGYTYLELEQKVPTDLVRPKKILRESNHKHKIGTDEIDTITLAIVGRYLPKHK